MKIPRKTGSRRLDERPLNASRITKASAEEQGLVERKFDGQEKTDDDRAARARGMNMRTKGRREGGERERERQTEKR